MRSLVRLASVFAVVICAGSAFAKPQKTSEPDLNLIALEKYASARMEFYNGDPQKAVALSFDALQAAETAEPKPGLRVKAALNMLKSAAFKLNDFRTGVFASKRLNAIDQLATPNYWLPSADGALRHWPTGFTCPNGFQTMRHREIYMYNSSGSDTSCELTDETTNSKIRLYLTKLSEQAAPGVLIKGVGDTLKSAYPQSFAHQYGAKDFEIDGAQAVFDENLLSTGYGVDTTIRFGTWLRQQDGWTVKLRIEWWDPSANLPANPQQNDQTMRELAQRFLAQTLPSMTTAKACAASRETLQIPVQPKTPAEATTEVATTVMATSIMAVADSSQLQKTAQEARDAGYTCVIQSAWTADGTEFLLLGRNSTSPGVTIGTASGYKAEYRVEFPDAPLESFWIFAAESASPDKYYPVFVKAEKKGTAILRVGKSWNENGMLADIADALAQTSTAALVTKR